MTATGAPETTARILAAAEAEFGAHGYRKATIGSIGERAGVSRQLVHRY
ncbi:MAG: helix-turn-helix domain-containing protein, partial [Actinomycetota bacterium]